MRNKEQSKNLNWHNYRFVLVLLSIAVFVVTSVMLIAYKDSVFGANSQLITVIFRLLAVAAIIALICYILIIVIDWILGRLLVRNLIKTVIADEIRKEIKNVYNVELSDALNNDGVKAAIRDAINDETKIDDVKTALANALIGNHNVQRETISKFLTENIAAEIESKKQLKKENKVKKIINKVLEKCLVKKIIYATLNVDDVKSKLSTVNEEKGELRNAIASSLKTDAMSVNEVRTTVSAALKDEGGKIKDVMSAIFEKVDISELIKSSLEDDNVKTEINKALDANELEDAKKSITDALDNDDVKSAISTALKNSVVLILDEKIQSKISACVQNAENNEKESQKYRFAEQVVAEICKNNILKAADIVEIRKLIGDVFGNDHKDCCVEICEDDNKYTFVFKDIDGKKLEFFNYKRSNRLYVSSLDGNYTLYDGSTIIIEGGKIMNIKKSM